MALLAREKRNNRTDFEQSIVALFKGSGLGNSISQKIKSDGMHEYDNWIQIGTAHTDASRIAFQNVKKAFDAVTVDIFNYRRKVSNEVSSFGYESYLTAEQKKTLNGFENEFESLISKNVDPIVAYSNISNQIDNLRQIARGKSGKNEHVVSWFF